MAARSRNTALPAMSLPTATSSGLRRLGRFRRREQVAERHELTLAVRHLDTDRRAAGDRSEDAHVGGRHRVGDVLLQARDPGDLDAETELELVASHGRADGHPDERGLDAVRRQRLLEHAAAGLDLLAIDGLLARAVEERHRRQDPLARRCVPSGEATPGLAADRHLRLGRARPLRRSAFAGQRPIRAGRPRPGRSRTATAGRRAAAGVAVDRLAVRPSARSLFSVVTLLRPDLVHRRAACADRGQEAAGVRRHRAHRRLGDQQRAADERRARAPRWRRPGRGAPRGARPTTRRAIRRPRSSGRRRS